MEYNERVFFNAGDVVRVKQDIDAPDMVVKHINKMNRQSDDNTGAKLLGITCFWYSKNYEYQSQLFSTKDLKHVSKK